MRLFMLAVVAHFIPIAPPLIAVFFMMFLFEFPASVIAVHPAVIAALTSIIHCSRLLKYKPFVSMFVLLYLMSKSHFVKYAKSAALLDNPAGLIMFNVNFEFSTCSAAET